ncbi:MAG: hypothetical protein JWL61_5003 [Gemmatimonadetes bacterium]|nr:hypothetical protein [Gemmatimonadota bacterium]
MGVTAGILQAAQTTTTFLGQRQEASALRDSAAFDTAQGNYLAGEATSRGEFDASRRAVAGRQMVGAQRAAAAASGIDANSGSAASIQADEAGLSAFDEQMIRNNAAREAWGFKAQSTLNAAANENEARAKVRDSYSTLLTGAGKTYNMFGGNSSKSSTKQVPADGFQDASRR